MSVIAGRLLEVGVAVSNLDQASRHFTHLLRAPISAPIEERESFGLRFTMARVGRADFEIMESIEPSGLVARFVARQGEGLHHIAFEIDDAQTAMRVLKSRGVPVLSDQPVRLANLLAFFIHPAYFGGMLVEFVQNLHPWLDGVTYQDDGQLPGLEARRITGITAVVSDVDSVSERLADTLGAGRGERVNSRWFDGPARRCPIGDIDLTLVPVQADQRPGLRLVSIAVDDLARSRANLERLGAQVRCSGSSSTRPDALWIEHADFHRVPVELIPIAS